jgi:hypothetical protein
MSIYEVFPAEVPRDLTDKELAMFAKAQVFAAAEHVWGEDFSDPSKLDDNEALSREFKSQNPDEPGKLELGLYIDAEFPQDDDNDGIDDRFPPDLYVGVSIETCRFDLTKILQKKLVNYELEVWEVTTFEFPVHADNDEDGGPLANRYYVLRVDDGDDIEPDELTPRQKRFLDNVSANPKYNPDRSIEINTQDAIDISNILLALEIPERVIGLTW